jgi:hypothetical protein
MRKLNRSNLFHSTQNSEYPNINSPISLITLNPYPNSLPPNPLFYSNLKSNLKKINFAHKNLINSAKSSYSLPLNYSIANSNSKSPNTISQKYPLQYTLISLHLFPPHLI